jgi:type VI secretion system protein ImpL
MLGDPAHFDAEALKAWISLDWDRNLPRDVSADQRAALAGHLNQLFADGPVASPVVQDAALVARSREMLLRYTLPDRIYSRLKRQGVGAEIPEFTIERAAGPAPRWCSPARAAPRSPAASPGCTPTTATTRASPRPSTR